MKTAEKIMQSLQEIAEPSDDAGGLQLAFATVATMMQEHLPAALAEAETNGELDGIILALCRWFASHRGDDASRLVVVELPRRRELPVMTVLHQVQLAEDAGVPASLPL